MRENLASSDLDKTDRRILETLQRKGRVSNADLSEIVHLSPSACHRRVARLEAEGFIRDYVALLDARKLGVPSTIFVEITLLGQSEEVLEAFEKAVARIPDVLECHLMAGSADYLLKIVAEDTEDFAASIASTCHVYPALRKCNLVSHYAQSSKQRPCRSRIKFSFTSLI